MMMVNNAEMCEDNFLYSHIELAFGGPYCFFMYYEVTYVSYKH
jgi:hypothetical protein